MRFKEKQKVILLILDGFGIRKEKKFNPILNADMQNYFHLWNKYPHTKLNASGKLVGLPYGQFGSSEVGHLTIGAGQLIKQPVERINEDINSGQFFKNKKLLRMLNFIKHSGGNIHLIGLIGPGGVHSLDTHLYALLSFFDKNILKLNKCSNIYIDAILDGRDTPQKSAIRYLDELKSVINHLYNKERFFISTLCGRYYAMDRDKRWERTEKAYNLLVHNEGFLFKNYSEAINRFYKKKITDEFMPPIRLMSKRVKENDLLLFYNFRADRPRELVQSFIDKDFKEFDTKVIENLKLISMTEYSKEFNIPVLYETIYPTTSLGKVLSNNRMKQLRIAESEKFPHVTYFFNGLKEKPNRFEERIYISSPKVATYDLKPEMSLPLVTTKLLTAIKEENYNFILVNFANPDMVGHTGKYEAVIKALKQIDQSLKHVKEVADQHNYLLIVTADHGNCETMKDKEGNPHTEHTNNLVPFILCTNKYRLKKDYHNLSLYNIAPTILKIMNIPKPFKMEDTLLK